MRRPAQYLYDNQPFADLTGVPVAAWRPHLYCGGTFHAEPGTQHFDHDGHAEVSLTCDRCRAASAFYWNWAVGIR